METFKSTISGVEFPKFEMVLGKTVREAIFKIIKVECPKFSKNSKLSISELNHYRQKYLETYFLNEAGEVSQLELDVLDSIKNQEIITTAILAEKEEIASSIGQRLADKVASFGGSWRFIIIFSLIIFF